MARRFLLIVLGLALTVPTLVPAAAQLVPGAVDPPVLSEPVPRGGVDVKGFLPKVEPPTEKVIDGDPSEWVGESTRLGGTTIIDRGEMVYQDFLFDDYGADDGQDAQRNEQLGYVYGLEPGTQRVEALTQAAGEQFDADAVDPTGGYLAGPAHYGDAVYPDGTAGQADLLEARLASDRSAIDLLVRTTAMEDAEDVAVLVLLGFDAHQPAEPVEVPFGSDLTTTRAERAFLVADGTVHGADLLGGSTFSMPSAEVAADPSGATNAIEVRLPLDEIPGYSTPREIAIGLGIHAGDGTLADVTPETDAGNLLNVAFREEPVVSNWFDKTQAFELLDGRIDRFFESVPGGLNQGLTYPWTITPGYHERVFTSREDISTETLEQGPKETVHQHYGLYLPSDWDPDEATPLTTWLHWRGGTAHQAAAWTPRMVEQLAEDREPSNVLVSPRGRGTSTWYTGAGHVDVLEVLDDVQASFTIDEDRRYVSGYSMGGYGSYLFGLLYPDLFAAAYPISGAVTQGAWLGVDGQQGQDVVEANGGDASVQLAYRLLENARNLPYVIHHGTDDELVPITGVERMAARLTELGYQHRLYRFAGYEHYTQAVVDEWAEGAVYLDEHTRDPTPARVVYKRVPAFEHATETLGDRGASIDLATDGAYWVSGITLRETSTSDVTVDGLVDVRSNALGGEPLTVPEAGAASTGHSTPYAMTGQRWIPDPIGAPSPEELLEPASEAVLEADLANVATVTLDLADANVTTEAPFEVNVTTDGTTALSLDGGWTTAPTVTVDGEPATTRFEAGVLTVDLGTGTHTLRVTPS